MNPMDRDDAMSHTIIHEALIALTVALAYLQLIRIRMERDPLLPVEQLIRDLKRAEAAVVKKAAKLRELEPQIGR